MFPLTKARARGDFAGPRSPAFVSSEGPPSRAAAARSSKKARPGVGSGGSEPRRRWFPATRACPSEDVGARRLERETTTTGCPVHRGRACRNHLSAEPSRSVQKRLDRPGSGGGVGGPGPRVVGLRGGGWAGLPPRAPRRRRRPRRPRAR